MMRIWLSALFGLQLRLSSLVTHRPEIWDRARGQSIGGGKLRANIAARVAGHLGVVFQPEEEALFELTTERLPDMGRHTRLEARNPP